MVAFWSLSFTITQSEYVANVYFGLFFIFCHVATTDQDLFYWGFNGQTVENSSRP